MKLADIVVVGNKATAQNIVCPTSGLVGATVAITYSPEWDSLRKTVLFRADDVMRERIFVDGSEVEIPWEVCVQENKPLEISIRGADADGNIVLTTNWESLKRIMPGANPGVRPTPTPGWADQIEGMIQTNQENIQKNSENLTSHVQNKGNPHNVTAEQIGAEAAGAAAIVQKNLDTHTADRNNPHSVTIEQIGADKKGAAASALTEAKAYTDAAVGGIVIPQEVTTAVITTEVGRLVCDMTAREIIDASRKGVVKAEYTDEASGETREYYYFKQMPDGRAVFTKDGYIEDGVPKQTLFYVDYAGNVTVETRESGSGGIGSMVVNITYDPDAGNPKIDKTYDEVMAALNRGDYVYGLFNEYALMYVNGMVTTVSEDKIIIFWQYLDNTSVAIYLLSNGETSVLAEPLPTIDDGASFAYTTYSSQKIEEDFAKKADCVSLSPQTLTPEQQKQVQENIGATTGGIGSMVVNITADLDAETATFDKTYDDIRAAIDRGDYVYGVFDSGAIGNIALDTPYAIMFASPIVDGDCITAVIGPEYTECFTSSYPIIDDTTPADYSTYTSNKIETDFAKKTLGISGASVGQVIRIKSVDAQGRPTAFEAVTM